jgi:drug/metabolite transporter (DMT)-like permease
MKSKFIAKISYIVFGIAIILFAFFNNGFRFPPSAENLGYDIWTLFLTGIGAWLIFKGVKHKTE